jgi:hypothetical protein
MTWNDWVALGKILGVGLLAGAGLPALFTVGLRLIVSGGSRTNPAVVPSLAVADPAATSPAPRAQVASFGAGLLCFAVVAAAIGFGIHLIVSG